MQFDPARDDPAAAGEAHCPKVLGVEIPSRTAGERMSGTLFTAAGQGAHPVILLLHGYPGYETNFDVAHALQRAGYAVLTFHYRGTWGSEGTFSLCNAIEDVQTAIEFIKNNAENPAYGFDSSRIVLVGHSTGGFLAFVAASDNADIVAVAGIAPFDFSLASNIPAVRDALRAEFADTVGIRRIPLDAFFQEIDTHAQVWRFPALAPGFINKPVYLIGGGQDTVSPADLHIAPLYDALMQTGAHAAVDMLDSTHCFSSKRIALSQSLIGFLQDVVPA